MEIQGKVVKILEPQRFSKGDGSEVVRHGFVVETTGERFSKKVCFSVLGDDSFNNMHIAAGGTYNVFFDVESREWKDKWFTECRAWKANPLYEGKKDAPAKESASPVPSAQPAPAGDGGGSADDLPF